MSTMMRNQRLILKIWLLRCLFIEVLGKAWIIKDWRITRKLISVIKMLWICWIIKISYFRIMGISSRSISIIKSRLVTNNYFLKKYKNVEDNLYALIKFKKTNKIQNALIYDDYNDLFQLFLKCNPEKVQLKYNIGYSLRKSTFVQEIRIEFDSCS